MHWTMVITHTLLAVLILSAARSNVAMVLFFAWAAGQIFWSETGNVLPIKLYLLTDTCAIVTMLALWLFFTGERFPRWVLSMYIPIWIAYCLPYGDLQWYTLWALTLGQFVAAGPWWMIRNHRDGRGLFAGDVSRFSLDNFRTVSHHFYLAKVYLFPSEAREHGANADKSGAHSEIEWKGR